jgi:anaerobic ribonucleoside-triphosphate reductase
MLEEITKFYQKMVNEWAKEATPKWFDFLKSEPFLNWMKVLHIYMFEGREKLDKFMENINDVLRLASKEDIKDLVDAQRLVIDLLEEINDRLNKIEEKVGKGGK